MGWRCSGFKDDSVQSALALQQFAANARSLIALFVLSISSMTAMFLRRTAQDCPFRPTKPILGAGSLSRLPAIDRLGAGGYLSRHCLTQVTKGTHCRDTGSSERRERRTRRP
jgi:hypothetical protein